MGMMESWQLGQGLSWTLNIHLQCDPRDLIQPRAIGRDPRSTKQVSPHCHISAKLLCLP